MKISVLIAAHGHGAQMREVLACVRAQTHSNWEIVVVEYGSADGTQAIVRDFATFEQRPVQCLTLGESHGAPSARNQLLELAGAEWVAFHRARRR
jgi:glycosyltransferase involved in cell wall biosynthesis